MNYSQAGTWTSVVGIIVIIASYFGLSLDASTIMQAVNDIAKVIGDLLVIYGIVHQYVQHRKLAEHAGIIPYK